MRHIYSFTHSWLFYASASIQMINLPKMEYTLVLTHFPQFSYTHSSSVYSSLIIVGLWPTILNLVMKYCCSLKISPLFSLHLFVYLYQFCTFDMAKWPNQ